MRLLLVLVVQFLFLNVTAQDSLYPRAVIKELTSSKYNGRGYVKSGDKKAARFISSEFQKLGLQPGGNSKWIQPFSFSVNTFPGKMKCSLNGKSLVPGVDFIVEPGMSSLKGTFGIVTITKKISEYHAADIKGKFILIDTCGTGVSVDKKELTAWKDNLLGAAGMILIQPKKLTWSVSTSAGKFPVIEMVKSSERSAFTNIQLEICAQLIDNYKTGNIIGLLPGTQVPDSFIYITAHYDHLGRMGADTYFPGANDNASGVSMLLNLAAWFTKPENRIKYTLVFIAFAGEEAGLIGSHYYTEHPLLSLSKIRFLVNLDLLGTGDEGLMVVNATEYPEAFTRLDSINTAGNLLAKIGKRGKAANSDHYFFTEKGVPSFFCYTLGGIQAYHDVFDVEKTLPLTKYKEVFSLLTQFVSSF